VGRYYLATSLPLEPIRNASDEFKNVITLDPGIRIFLTVYNIHGKSIAFGKEGMKNIFKKLYLSDKLNSIANKKENDNYQYNYRKRQTEEEDETDSMQSKKQGQRSTSQDQQISL
jgi:transposase